MRTPSLTTLRNRYDRAHATELRASTALTDNATAYELAKARRLAHYTNVCLLALQSHPGYQLAQRTAAAFSAPEREALQAWAQEALIDALDDSDTGPAQ